MLCGRHVGKEGPELSRVAVVQVGERARAALARSGGVAAPLAGFADAPYLEADGDVVWVGPQLPARHPRAVVTACAPPRGVALRFGTLPAHGWSPRAPDLDQAAKLRAIESVAALRQALLREQAPRGFGILLAGRRPDFPLGLAVPRIEALVEAYRRDDPESVLLASIPLLGFGAGLTPSGDDLAGAALFGRRLLRAEHAGWKAVAGRLSREVALRSHALSAALFDDLARGESFAPLHDLAAALAREDRGAALAAARTLCAIGHSSGWDMLAGLVIGLTGGCQERAGHESPAPLAR